MTAPPPPIEIFSAYLRRHSLSLTRQREEILNTFLGAGEHVSAEKLAELVRAQDPSVGLSTVYRTLKLLVECGIAEELRFEGDTMLYEFVENHHEHMVCLECRQITEFEDEELENLKARIASAHGFKMVRHTLQLYGICGNCQKEGAHVEQLV